MKLLFFLCVNNQIIFQNQTYLMKPYFIFVIILTVLYILYYAAMIARDLYGKKNGGKSDEEEFDVSDMESEGSVSVVENDKGFNIGENEYETGYAEEPPSERPRSEGKPRRNVVDMLNESVKTNMEETQVTFSNPYNAAELYKRMLEQGVGGQKAKSGLTAKPVINEL